MPSSAVYAPFQISKDEQISIHFPFTPLWGSQRGTVRVVVADGYYWFGSSARPLGPAFGSVGKGRVSKYVSMLTQSGCLQTAP